MAQSVEDTLLVRMEASLRKFERQMEGGRKAAESSAVRSERAWKRAGDKITANSNRAASGLRGMPWGEVPWPRYESAPQL